MQHLSSREAQNNFGMLLDTVQRHPVIIQKHKRDCAVIISIQDYELLKKSRILELQNLCDKIGKNAKSRGLTPEILDQLLQGA